MDINRVKELLPHRYPFLLIDKIISIKENEIVGVKNITINEPFFKGHFPDEPVMPGVLLIEAMAQTGGLLVLNRLEGKYSTYFIRIDNVKFRKKVVPGDTLIFKLALTSPIRRGIANMKGITYVGDKIVAEGEFMAQIVKQTEN
jgi:UDP-3-O-[3-hydroxymyristoyl] N-acetylglucosamine deacetylase/3-hydroxyacyl-[acyl-carrier-protein] dehydratase